MESNKRKKDITFKDISKEAGVSLGPVSNFFTGKKRVKKKLSKKIESIVYKYDYHVNISASSLRSKKTKMIGVIIPDSSNLVLSSVTKEIERIANKFGYNVVICNSDNKFSTEIDHINVLKSRYVDGIIIIPSKEDINIFSEINLQKTPVVLINRKIEKSNIDYVSIDTYDALLKVIDFLNGLGHKKIAYMNRLIQISESKDRFRGYMDGLRKNKIVYDEKFIINGEGFFLEDGYKDMVKILNLNNRPTAVIAFNDLMAIGAIKAIRDYNLKVPDDFSIVGFDNSFINDYIEPPLTSIAFQEEKIANIAFSILLDRINGDKSPQKGIKISSSLIIRDSTRKNKR